MVTSAAVEYSPDEWGGVYALWRGELAQNPKERELELLREYAQRHKSYPRCNQRS